MKIRKFNEQLADDPFGEESDVVRKISASELSRKSLEEIKEILKREGDASTHQFQEWWDIFQLQMYGRKCNLSELELHSILSNRFEIRRK